jgi:hypothetical protein
VSFAVSDGLLSAAGITNHVFDPASITAEQRARRAKTAKPKSESAPAPIPEQVSRLIGFTIRLTGAAAHLTMFGSVQTAI